MVCYMKACLRREKAGMDVIITIVLLRREARTVMQGPRSYGGARRRPVQHSETCDPRPYWHPRLDGSRVHGGHHSHLETR